MNVHVLADESLGGIKREYIEVDRPADEGDLIVCTKECALGGRFYGDGDVGVMQYKSDDYSSIYVKFLEGFGDPVSECKCYVGNDAYTTLEPTDIVHIDGTRYRLVDRKAEVGERVIVVNDEACPQHVGMVGVVEFVYDSEVSVNVGDVLDYYPFVVDSEYRVLEPLATEEETCACVTESDDSPQVIDMLEIQVSIWLPLMI